MHELIVLAIDPGPEKSALILLHQRSLILIADIRDNLSILSSLAKGPCSAADVCAIEMIASYGMPVGKEVFETCCWIGRFHQVWFHTNGVDPLLIPRSDIKLHHCQSARAKDANIRQALIDKYGAPGTKANRGVTYGLKSHLWASFALATYVTETHKQPITAVETRGLLRGNYSEKARTA